MPSVSGETAMTNSEKKEWRLWWRFFVRRVREFGFVTAWVMMSWGLHSYIVAPFPLEGSPKYMFWTFEGGGPFPLDAFCKT